jgi:hypothetical protein
VIAVPLSDKYSRAPSEGLAGRFDQSWRAYDYPPRPAQLPGLRDNFTETARQFP